MQEIVGMTISELIDSNTPNTVELVDRRNAVLKALQERYKESEERKQLYSEVEAFASAMHEVCLHGDIKPSNLMADERGDIYLIDFGQSVDMNLMSEKTREQFENLQTLERHQLTSAIRTLLMTAAGREKAEE
jgi:serine/threonine protein kinase